MAKPTEAERFWAKVDRSGGPDACWIWTGEITHNGYGRFRHGAARCRSHRWSYESAIGPIPEGLQLDHLCRNRSCVNPAHLEAVTQRENQLRGDTLGARNAAKTHCANGHPFSGSNLFFCGNRRKCRACSRYYSLLRWSRKRNENPEART